MIVYTSENARGSEIIMIKDYAYHNTYDFTVFWIVNGEAKLERKFSCKFYADCFIEGLIAGTKGNYKEIPVETGYGIKDISTSNFKQIVIKMTFDDDFVYYCWVEEIKNPKWNYNYLGVYAQVSPYHNTTIIDECFGIVDPVEWLKNLANDEKFPTVTNMEILSAQQVPLGIFIEEGR